MATMNIFQWYWGHHVSRYLRAPNPKSHRHPPIAPLHLSHHSSASTELGVERERVEREKEGELALFTHGVRCSSARRRARSIEWMASDAATAAVEREGKSYWGMSARMCDSCRGAAALLFCRADSAFLCLGCDARVHGANRLASRHERVWMCEVCEQAPAAVTCKADAAALCTSCDADIHSANPLSRRHERTPVVPFCHSPAAAEDRRRAHAGGEDDDEKEEEEEEVEKDEDEEDVTAAWLLGSTVNKVGEEKEKEKMLPAGTAAGGGFFYPEVDPYLDLDYAASMDARFHHLDSVVPVQQHNRGSSTPMIQHHGQAVLGAPYDFSGVKPSYSYAPSLSHSVSSSEVGVVPDGNSLADVSNPYVTGVPANPAALMNPAAILAPAVGMDREARVLRYREKRKNRKFEKTIRYASRKAYAETRPRIKGRFAKRTDADQPDSGVEGILAGGGGMYSAGAAAQGLMLDHGYGVVPSF